MALVVSSLRSLLIVTVATTMAFGSADIYDTFTNGMQREVSQIVTGDDNVPTPDPPIGRCVAITLTRDATRRVT